MEQAKQYSTMKINEAQHAHQEMKKAEDYARQLRQQAQLHKKKSEDLEKQLSQLSNDQANQAALQQTNAMQTGYGGVTSVGYSEPSYGQSRPPAVGYSGGFPGAPPTYPVDDASGLMGGSTGHGEGVMGGYASSVAFTDASGFGGSTHGSASVTGSISQYQGGYSVDAASHSVASELLYPPVETPNNAGSVSGGLSVAMSTAGSVNQTGTVSHIPGGGTSVASRSVVSEMIYPSNENIAGGSVSQIHGMGYTSDAASHSLASEMVYPSNENMSHAGSVAQQSASVSHAKGGNASDTGSLSVGFENSQPPAVENSNDVGDVNTNVIPTIANTQAASNDTYEMNNISNNEMQQQETTVPEITEQIPPGIENGGSNDFGSFMSGTNNNNADLGLIPSPEKEEIIQSKSNDSFDFTLLRSDQQDLTSGNVQPTMPVPIETQETTDSNGEEIKAGLHIDPTQNNNNNTSMVMDSSGNNLIPSPEKEERKITLDHGSENALPKMKNLADVQSTNVEVENVNLTEEEPTAQEEMGSAAPDNGLIPSPVNSNFVQDNNAATSSNLATNPDAESGIPSMNDLGVMTKSKDSSIGLGSMNLTAINQNKSAETMNFGIMSQSEDGGIPTPTASKDEYDQSFW